MVSSYWPKKPRHFQSHLVTIITLELLKPWYVGDERCIVVAVADEHVVVFSGL